jgi:hypothetical protein
MLVTAIEKGLPTIGRSFDGIAQTMVEKNAIEEMNMV